MYDELKTFFDSREIADGQEIDCDVCIIGSGAAGITIAREIANQDLKVVILESGGLDYDDATQNFAKVIVTGHRYWETASRLRLFGGTTNHWGGQCVPLRSYIFDKRDWVPDGEWPFGLAELKPYYARAHKVLEIGPYNYDPLPVAKKLDLPLLPFDPAGVETVLSRYHRQLFGYRYRDEIDRAANIHVFLFATASSLSVSDDARRVTHATVKTLAGNSFSVRPKIAVLAAGGIENARLLLISNHEIPTGIGNQHDLVGRYFSDHIWYPSGFILPVDQDPAAVKIYEDEVHFEDDYSVRCHLALPERRNQELRIPDYRAELAIRTTYAYHDAVVSARRIWRDLKALNLEYLTTEDMLNVLSDPIAPVGHLFDQKDGPLVYGFGNYVEQVPNRDSRVRLSAEKDALGMNRPELRWQLSNLDKEGIVKAQESIAVEVGRSRLGRMNIFIPDSEETILDGAVGGYHHMGTARMHQDPKRGVVDGNARVHGVENLFIAGSSVFPSYGYSNPTLTIVALSIRLEDHLKMVFTRAK
jgi:choline dehydrogenase-like flavoprotein